MVSVCGASQASLTREEIDRMPREARLAIYDGENDVVIANSRRDEALARVAATERDLKDLDRRWDLSERRLKKANLGLRVALGRKMVHARRAYLKTEVGIAEAEVKAAAAEVETARARLELVRQRQLARTGRVLAATLGPYEKRVAAQEKQTRELDRRALDLRAEAQKVFEGWKKAEEDYASATGDFDTGIWID